MRCLSMLASALFVVGLVATVSPLSGCGGPSKSNFGHGGDSGGGGGSSGFGGSGGTAGINLGGDGGGGSSGSGGTVAPKVPCPAGLTCDLTCPAGSSTTLTGKVYDPGFRDPLYDISVYVPEKALTPLPKGVPTGADACSCGALYESGAYVATTTAVDGTFTLTDVPVGAGVPLVIQVGKWRRLYHLDIKACAANPVPDKTLGLPASVAPDDTNDNMPDIAVSTGSADTLECLMTRIGLPPSEYVAGTAGGGHVHVFSGGMPGGGFGAGYGGVGGAEVHPMPSAPASYTDLWMNSTQLMPYDIVLLSCEGGETWNANPPALYDYLNAGGRAFASHFHYAWFSGPIASGTNLASWAVDKMDSNGPVGGTIDKTLNGTTMPFAKGVALAEWLADVDALGGGFPIPKTELPIYQPRYNAKVSPRNKPSQPWITTELGLETSYFSFDTPVGSAEVCGRAVFSDLHVSGSPETHDSSNNMGSGAPPPAGCDTGELSPQEKALEFMLFDLSNCVIPDTQPPPPPDAGLPPPPK
jgi:hypothetical protein